MSDIKIKPIKQGMVIHCSKQEEADELFKMLRELGYIWYFGDDLKHKFYERYNEDTCYCVEENLKITYGRINFFKENKFEITEFSDLLNQKLPVVESYHEKKEPEVKWFLHAEVHGKGFDSIKNCDSEQEAIKFVEEELKKAGKNAYGEYKRTCVLK